MSNVQKLPAQMSPEHKKKVQKYAIIGAGALGVSALAYYAVTQLQKSKESVTAPAAATAPVPSVVAGRSTSTWTEGSFPLKQGDYNNNKVYRIQVALGLGSGADGDFGPATAAALQAKGFPVVIDEITYNRILGGTSVRSGTSINAKTLANSIYQAAISKNLTTVLSGLRQMKSVSDYSSVNEEYKKIGLISSTLVTHLLGNAYTFSSEADKQQIRDEFLRMGLKYNGTTWSLSGELLGIGEIESSRIIKTRIETAVNDHTGNKYLVPANNILGTELGKTPDGLTVILSPSNVVLFATTDLLTYTK